MAQAELLKNASKLHAASVTVHSRYHADGVQTSGKISLASLEALYKTIWKSAKDYQLLTQKTLELSSTSVPLLLKVMKNSSYPENNRWMATFNLTRLMGKKTAPVLAKFLNHPHWMMRLAALKCLTLLRQSQMEKEFIRLLRDPSLIIRKQALVSIDQLKLTTAAPYVWQMFKDQDNYSGSNHNLVKTDLIDQVILTLGNLGHAPAIKPFTLMMQDEKHKELAYVLDYSLEKLTGKTSPPGDWTKKRKFWQNSYTNDNSVKTL